MFKIIFWVVILINYGAINFCVFAGNYFKDVSFLFQERQAMTFISALQLALTSFVALSIYILGRIIYKKEKKRLGDIRVWGISAVVFAFFTLDEYFMMHRCNDADERTARCIYAHHRHHNRDDMTVGTFDRWFNSN